MTTQTPYDLAFELSERELGATIGYPALVYEPSDVMDITELFGEPLRTDAQQIDALRLALDEAHQHVGALVAAIDELDDMGEWIWSEADDATLLSIHLSESHHTELNDRKDAARAWLRRTAR